MKLCVRQWRSVASPAVRTQGSLKSRSGELLMKQSSQSTGHWWVIQHAAVDPWYRTCDGSTDRISGPRRVGTTLLAFYSLSFSVRRLRFFCVFFLLLLCSESWRSLSGCARVTFFLKDGMSLCYLFQFGQPYFKLAHFPNTFICALYPANQSCEINGTEPGTS